MDDPRTVVCVVAAGSKDALSERLALVACALRVARTIEVGHAQSFAQLRRSNLYYLLDTNRATCLAGLALRSRRAPYIVDTGDDTGQLARNLGFRTARLRARAADQLLRGAMAIVHRGTFHAVVLRSKTDVPLHFAPDTVADDVLDRPARTSTEPVVASFGSAGIPPRGDRAYGWEVIDAVATTPGTRGVLVVRGPGIECLRDRAQRFEVSDRVTIHGPTTLAGLERLMGPVTVVTSVQTDDLAGWVRTTGKLPLALGMGKMVAASAVGEATRVLPRRFLLPSDDGAAALRIGTLALECTAGDTILAKRLAENFRRSTVAMTLRAFVNDVCS